jgi:hypothetical protein
MIATYGVLLTGGVDAPEKRRRKAGAVQCGSPCCGALPNHCATQSTKRPPKLKVPLAELKLFDSCRANSAY